MFLFRKKQTLAESGFFRGFIDWHSHILPGVDDGFKSLEDSLAVLDMYQEAGIREVWLTPHVMEDIPNTTDGLRQRFDELRKAYRGRVILRLAAEYMLDTLFEDRLDRDDLLPIGQGGRHLLVETSYFNPPANLLAILTGIKSRGYYPVLAHPERYVYMGMQDYSLLSDSGVKFQLNLLATGTNGLIYRLHYSSSGFMLVYTVCTSSNSSSLSTILFNVSRTSGVTSFKSFGI